MDGEDSHIFEEKDGQTTLNMPPLLSTTLILKLISQSL